MSRGSEGTGEGGGPTKGEATTEQSVNKEQSRVGVILHPTARGNSYLETVLTVTIRRCSGHPDTSDPAEHPATPGIGLRDQACRMRQGGLSGNGPLSVRLSRVWTMGVGEDDEMNHSFLEFFQKWGQMQNIKIRKEA